MKKILISMLAMAAMVSCSSESDLINEVNPTGDGKVEIKMTAGIGEITTKAAVNKGDALSGISFLRADSSTNPDWDTTTGTSVNASMSAAGAITFTPVQYYEAANNAYFVGYYPTATVTNGVVSYTNLTGTDDIMYSATKSGSKSSAATPIQVALIHKLTQIKFKIIAESTEAATVWGDVTSIELVDQNNKASLKLNDGTISFSADTKSDYPVFNTSTTLTTTEQNAGSVLAEPTLSKYSIRIKTSTFTTGQVIDLSGVTGEASKSYVATITFKGTTVGANGTIGEWTEVSGGSGDMK